MSQHLSRGEIAYRLRKAGLPWYLVADEMGVVGPNCHASVCSIALRYAKKMDLPWPPTGKHVPKDTGFRFWKSCVELSTREELVLHAEMRAHSREITYGTFRRAVGGASLDAWAKDHHYTVGRRGPSLLLCRDWHVAYNSSWWGDARCYYLDWSAQEHIWLPVISDS